MDETNLSWRARLAKANINILDIHDNTVFLEFTYHPKPGTFKWCKTVYQYEDNISMDSLADGVLSKVLTLRKELKG